MENNSVVLFVSSGNVKKFGISPIVINQGESLKKNGIEVIYYGIKGKGLVNYFKNIKALKHFIKERNIDIIHAHYSLSGFVATFASRNKTLIVSLMGSDSKAGFFFNVLIKFFYAFFWDKTIVKSLNIKTDLSLNNAVIIPNGVDFELFKPMAKEVAIQKVAFSSNKKYVVFIADPQRKEKNLSLAEESIAILKQKMDVELFVVFGDNGITNSEIPYYLNAADALILTSLHEGSPNVVKEAMACNCPVVSTDVGDVKNVIATTDGCFVTTFDSEDIASKLFKAITHGRTQGRKNIEFLDSNVIAKKLLDIYNEYKN